MNNRRLKLVFLMLSTFCSVGLLKAEVLFGVSAHFAKGAADIDIALIKQLGVRNVRVDAFWSLVERKPGVYQVPEEWDRLVDSLKESGVEVTWILCYGNWNYDILKPSSLEERRLFVKYVEHVVRHFKGRVQRYEVWNEWELRTGNTEPGGVDSYISLVRDVYPAVKSIDETVDVLVGAVSSEGMEEGYLEEFLRRGGMKYGDGLSLHPYVHCEASRNKPSSWARWMNSVYLNLFEWNGGDLDVYLTEMGWPTHIGPCGIEDSEQGVFLESIMGEIESMDFIKGVWWFSFKDAGTDQTEIEHNYGLLDYDYAKKPSFLALRTYLRRFSQ